MTKEQEEKIEKLRKITNKKILYGNKFGITIEGFRELQEDIETVLNMLKEKDKQIEKLKRQLADNLVKDLKDSIKAKNKANTDLEDLNRGWELELEKKDKMIDLMAEEMKKRATCPLDDYNYDLDCENKCNNNTKECWKQYFERKVEDECKR